MRIGYVLKRYPRYSETFVVSEILAHEAAGLEIEIFSLRPPEDTHFQDAIARVRAPVNYLSADNGLKGSDFWAAIEQASQSLPGLWTALETALSANQGLYEVLVRAGRFDLVYERYSLWSFAGMEYARAMAIPGLLEVNSPLILEQVQHRGLVDRAGAERVAERVFGASGALIAVSEEVAAYLERYPSARGRIHIVPNGVNPERFPAGLQPACPAASGVFTIGFVGKVRPWHGLPVLIEAFAIFHRREPRSRLLIVGEVPELPDLIRDLTSRELLEAVQCTGAVAPGQVPGMLASMDVAVAPYPNESDFYFSPLKVYEYMASGLPVVASRVGQLARLIEDNVNGLLCPPGEPIALVAALDRLRCEPALRARLGYAARQAVLKDHTWDIIARRILDLADLQPSAHVYRAEATA